MSSRRCSSSGRGGLHVRGRRRRARFCLKTCLQRKLRELQRKVPGSHGILDVQTLFKTIENYVISLEAKVSVLRNLSTLYGV